MTLLPSISTLAKPAERQAFIEVYHDTFYKTSGSDNDKDKNIENLAWAADGMTLDDIDSLATISRKEHIDISDAKTLIKHFKFSSDKSPWDDLSDENINKLEEKLKGKVIGQDHAIEAIKTMVICAKVGLSAAKNVDIIRSRYGF